MPASCEDDLTLSDLLISSTASSRQTSGAASTTNLFAQIDRDQVWGLNLDEDVATASAGEGPGPAKAVIKPWEDRDSELTWVDSGVDDQLILEVPFIQNVRVRSILIKTARGSRSPTVLKIYANRPGGVAFDNTNPPPEGLKPAQEVSLSSSTMLGVIEYPLKVQIFKDVVSLSLFFGESEGGEQTRLYYVGFLGDPRNPGKSHDTEMSIPAAQGADAPIDGVREANTPRNTTIR